MRNNIPVQVWSPLFYKSPFDKFSLDLQRAYKEWIKEDRIWLIPKATEVIRWRVDDNNFLFYEAIVPSDELNVITIYHIDEQNRIFPSFPEDENNTLEISLYKKWLQKYFTFYPGADSITIILPVIKNNEVESYEEKEIKIKPGSMMPITDVNSDDYKFIMRWPSKPSIVSPDIESKNFYGNLKFEKLKYIKDNKKKQTTVVSSEKEPKGKAINLWIKWPQPFDSFFQYGGNIDIIYSHAHMRNCIKKIANGGRDKQKAIQEVERITNTFVSDGQTILEKSFFLPRVTANMDALLMDAQFKFGIEANNISQLLKSNTFIKKISSKVKIKRIYSWLGYFWWEFFQDVSANINIRFCANCGNIISGGKINRIYCNQEENIECFRQRNANRQKKSYRKKYNL